MTLSPVPRGNGAFVVHSQLAQHLPNYHVLPYSPKRSFFPPSYYPLGRKRPANIIHAVPDSAIFHARANTPLVLTLHGYAIDKALYPYSSWLQNLHGRLDLRWLHQMAVKRADVITAVSHFTANLAKADLGIEKPIKVIYNGVDEQRFIPNKRGADKEIRVLFSGNLTRRKGAHWLLPIIQRLDERIVIYYTSGLRETSELVAHPRLRPLGRIAHEKMPEIYQQMDILLFPTVREGFGLAAAEAMACGLPVVATNGSSLPEVVTHEQGGLLCPLGDVEAFASAIQALAEDSNLRQRMGAFNRAEVEQRFTLQQMVTQYHALFDTLTNPNHA
ncbi:glycosyltransferase family 4 protein [Thiothrix lacustris]|uniref:glycosyltransferase family 4 protein n=1 Tax=Thiothrix lacustris TaxID=525917 RepID=UPI00048EF48B|nr:glycosyltransferase family 4 protein [Thiothrix lacustris]